MSELYNFNCKFSQTYSNKCVCGQEIDISTQEDNSPEYYSIIFIKCTKCGKSIKFSLPVN